jgi:hypothetical protein
MFSLYLNDLHHFLDNININGILIPESENTDDIQTFSNYLSYFMQMINSENE